MTESEELARKICAELSQHPAIRFRLDAVLWFGSASRNADIHNDSDLDLQVVMDRPEAEATLGLASILTGRNDVDLSVAYRADIFRQTGELDFQDGTKGSFFVYVLAGARTLYGTNPYRVLLDQLSLAEVRPSLMFTIREYLTRLRVMVVQGLERPFEFKKYSLKFFKDVLVAAGALPLAEMADVTNCDVVDSMRCYYRFPNSLLPALDEITDLASRPSLAVRAALLTQYEAIALALPR